MAEEKHDIRIEGMHCATCAVNIEENLRKVKGVKTATVNFATSKATVAYDSKDSSLNTFKEVVRSLGYKPSDVKEEDFRYPGPKPQTKESAVIGIADSVEAAVRSLAHPTHEQIETLVRNIIADRLQDGQLGECDITLKELDTVADTLCETLKGIFHSRIEYPEMNKQKVKQA